MPVDDKRVFLSPDSDGALARLEGRICEASKIAHHVLHLLSVRHGSLL